MKRRGLGPELQGAAAHAVRHQEPVVRVQLRVVLVASGPLHQDATHQQAVASVWGQAGSLVRVHGILRHLCAVGQL